LKIIRIFTLNVLLLSHYKHYIFVESSVEILHEGIQVCLA